MKAVIESEYRIAGKDRDVYLPHYNDSVEILQMWSQGGNILYNNAIFDILPRQIYVIDGRKLHCTNPTDADRYVRSKVVMSREYFDSLADLMGVSDHEFISALHENGILQISPDESVSRTADRIFRLCSQIVKGGGELARAHVTEQLVSLMNCILESRRGARDPEARTDDIAQSILGFVKQNYKEQFSLDDAAKHLHISKYYICHQFKASFGMTVGKYVSDLKLTEAQDLLVNTQMSVGDIASAVGFITVNSFCRLFKSRCRCTPLEYRRKYSDKPDRSE